jgi:hypothetical protein
MRLNALCLRNLCPSRIYRPKNAALVTLERRQLTRRVLILTYGRQQ